MPEHQPEHDPSSRLLPPPNSSPAERSPNNLSSSPPKASSSSPEHLEDGSGDGFTVQDALDSMGFGPWQAMLFVYAGLFWACDAMEIMLLAYIGPAAQCEWHLTSTQESWLSSAVFGGMLLGACFWGGIADLVGRVRAGLAMCTATVTFGVLSALAPTYLALVVARTGVGFGLAGTITQYTLFVEWLPQRVRGRWLVLIGLCFTAGTGFEIGLAWALLNSGGWRLVVGLSAVPFGLMLLAIPFVPDSPKLLVERGDFSKARRLLSAAAAFNRKALPPGRLKPCSPARLVGSEDLEHGAEHRGIWKRCSGAVRVLAGDVSALLQAQAGVATALCVAWWCGAFCYYYTALLATELSALDNRNSTISNGTSSNSTYSLYSSTYANSSNNSNSGSVYSMYSGNSSGSSSRFHAEVNFCTGPDGRVHIPEASFGDVLLTASSELPSTLFCLLAVGTTPLARYPATARSFLAAAASLTLLIVAPGTHGTVLQMCLFGARFFASAAFVILYILTPEALPTRIRASAMGACNAASRLGGVVAPFAAVALVQHGLVWVSALTFVVACLAASLSVAWVALQTRGQELKLGP